ncbi:hypothetical protein DPMN_053249 [Dreissena polymorpha]|uniref:Uncharacterized protein n=1 Tax=Dreissena polymorpha TaxID=45954 RepID=A0A9D4HS02_DREPO|nr:hypothetical protein DPMN_053249 [Dreissena polymorpha]
MALNRSVNSWSVRVETEARVTRRRFSHMYKFLYRGELLRAALLIQLSPPPWEPDVFFTASFAVSSKMQRSSQPLLIDGGTLSSGP